MTPLLCRLPSCGNPRCYIGIFRAPFCSGHCARLAPGKHAKMMTIATMNVLEPGSHAAGARVVDECLRYLREHKEERKHANG